MWIDLLALAAGYLLGSIPFPCLVVKAVTGQDLRRVSNGNVGARNAIRVAGMRWGLMVALMLLAIAKKVSDIPRQKRIRGEEA